MRNGWIHFTVGQINDLGMRKVYLRLCIENVEFFEYLGEKDKNDVEIYRGDICKYYNHFMRKECIGEIRYLLTSYWFWFDGELTSFDALFRGEHMRTPGQTTGDFEIIGNTTQNRELIPV